VKGLLVVLTAFVFLPGSVFMLLASNFGALKGYLIAAVGFFGFMVMLSAVWLFGIPGTTPLTGPKGTQPTFKFFTVNDPVAATYDSVRDFQGGAGNGWEPAPEGEFEEGTPEATLRADLDTARQTAVQDLIEETNADIEDSSEELDATNVSAEVFYTIQDGTEVAAVVISPATPPEGSGLQRPDFAPETFFAYRDPGSPYLPSILFLVGSVVLFLVHLFLLGVAERRRPLGQALTPTTEPERQPAGAGAARR
jgi:hypothetical protein